MSRHYWSVQGYGIEIKESMFDVSKMRPLTDLSKEVFEDLMSEDGGSAIFEDGFIGDVLDSLSPMLQHGDTGNLHLGSYLIYPFKAPWELEEFERFLTKEDIINLIGEVLLPYLKVDYNDKWLKKGIDYIHICGGS